MNPESWQDTSEQNPETIALNLEYTHTKEEIIEDIQRVLSFRLGMSHVDNPEPVLDELFDSLSRDIEELSRHYADLHPEIKDKQKLEDNALTEAGFGDVPAVLDRIQEVRDMLTVRIPNMATDNTTDIITPPDEGKKIVSGSGDGLKETVITSRLKMVLFVLLNDCGISEDFISITKGSIADDMMRKEPYVAVKIPDLNRLVVVCDEVGNRTDVFDISNPAYLAEEQKEVLLLTKKEKDRFGEMYPGAHTILHYSNGWSDRLYDVLVHPIPAPDQKKIRYERPATFEVVPEADESGFYTDPQGTRWGSISQIAISIFGNKHTPPSFTDLLAGVETRKMSQKRGVFIGYDYNLIKSLVEENEQLSAYTRKTNKEGVFNDERGKSWMFPSRIAKQIFGYRDFMERPEFKALLANLSSLKILSGNNVGLAYELDETKQAVLQHPELSAYLRDIGKDGFYKDDTGERWGSSNKISIELTGGKHLFEKPGARELLSSLQTLKVMGGSNMFDAYKLEEVRSLVADHPILKKYLKA